VLVAGFVCPHRSLPGPLPWLQMSGVVVRKAAAPLFVVPHECASPTRGVLSTEAGTHVLGVRGKTCFPATLSPEEEP